MDQLESLEKCKEALNLRICNSQRLLTTINNLIQKEVERIAKSMIGKFYAKGDAEYTKILFYVEDFVDFNLETRLCTWRGLSIFVGKHVEPYYINGSPRSFTISGSLADFFENEIKEISQEEFMQGLDIVEKKMLDIITRNRINITLKNLNHGNTE